MAFGRITIDKAESGLVKKMTIVNNVEGMMTLTDVVSTNPIFKPEIRMIEAGKKYELVVSLQPPLKSGNNSGRITMKTGLGEKATLDVPAYAYVSSPVDVTPAKLTLPVNRTADLKRQFYVRSNTTQPVVLSDLQASNPDLKLAIADIRKQLTYRLTVDIPASYKPSPAGDTISFKTSNPAVPSITIPITERAPRKPVARPANISAKRRSLGASIPTKREPAQKTPVPAGAPKAKKAGASEPAAPAKAPTKVKALPKAGSQSNATPAQQTGPKGVTSSKLNAKRSVVSRASASKAIPLKRVPRAGEKNKASKADAEK